MGACIVLAGMDATAKYLVAEVPPMQVIWARYTGAALVFLIWFGWQNHWHLARPKRPGLQLLRSVALVIVTVGNYVALTVISLADATAILFLAPVLLTVFAAWFLKEPIGKREWLAVAMGFGGVLFIARPGQHGFEPIMLLSFVAAVFLGLYFVITRYLKDHDDEITTQFFTPVAGAVLLSLLVPLFWETPSLQQALLMGSMGLAGALGHGLLTTAFHMAPAGLLSPFLYSQLAVSAVISSLFFQDILDWPFYLGALLIVSAGILVSRRKRNA